MSSSGPPPTSRTAISGCCRRRSGQRAQQQVQPLIGIERAEEGEDGFPAKPERGCESAVGNPRPAEGLAIDRIGDDRDLVAWDAAGDRFGAQTLADRRHGVGAMQRAGLDEPRRPVTQAGLAVGAMARRRVLPQSAHLVDDRDPVPSAGAERRQRVEDRRVGVQDLRAAPRRSPRRAAGRDR